MATRREGDWDCPDCGMLVFASKDTCFKCSPGGKGGGKAQREGDWHCPDCGALVFASKDTCFRCEAGWAGGKDKGDRRAGDWTCPDCGINVFASKTECFKCGKAKPSGKNASASKAPKAAQPVTAATSIKALAKLSPKFRKAWVAYCASYAEGQSDPGEHDEDFISEFVEYVGDVVSSDVASAAATAAPAEKAAKRPAVAAPTGAPPEKKKLTIKKAVADEIRRLNAAGGLLAQIRVAAVADALGKLGEEGALAALAALEEQQADTEDPNEFLNNCELEEDDS